MLRFFIKILNIIRTAHVVAHVIKHVIMHVIAHVIAHVIVQSRDRACDRQNDGAPLLSIFPSGN